MSQIQLNCARRGTFLLTNVGVIGTILKLLSSDSGSGGNHTPICWTTPYCLGISDTLIQHMSLKNMDAFLKFCNIRKGWCYLWIKYWTFIELMGLYSQNRLTETYLKKTKTTEGQISSTQNMISSSLIPSVNLCPKVQDLTFFHDAIWHLSLLLDPLCPRLSNSTPPVSKFNPFPKSKRHEVLMMSKFFVLVLSLCLSVIWVISTMTSKLIIVCEIGGVPVFFFSFKREKLFKVRPFQVWRQDEFHILSIALRKPLHIRKHSVQRAWL